MAGSKDPTPKLEPTLKQPVPSAEAERRFGSTAHDEVQSPGRPPSVDGTLPFRPLHRPPTAIVSVLSDDGRTCETFTVRSESFRFGRTEGDLIINHDAQISGLHCELTRRLDNGRHQWYLRDLGSRNGTFVKITEAQLNHDSALIIGCHRYRFDTALQGAASVGDSATSEADDSGTQGWQIPTQSDFESFLPALIRLTPEGDGERFPLPDTDQLIGRDEKQSRVVLAGDPMVSPVHARIFQDSSKRWYVENKDSLNGIWFAIREKRLDVDTQFQIGEQRIKVRFPE